jgi:hypothetical protein
MRVHSARISVTTVIAITVGVTAHLLGAPTAHAAFTPSKTSSVTVSVDGVTLGIEDSVSDMSGNRSGVFGGAVTPASGSDPGTNELTEMYVAKDGSFVNFEARGGIVAVSCSGGGTTYYRRAQVTVGNLPTGTNDVWVFSDAEVGPRVGPTPSFNNPGTRTETTANIQKLCDGTTQYVAGTAGVLTLGSDRVTAGVQIDDTTATSVSFDIYVPTNGTNAGSTENFIALGIVVDEGGTGSLNDTGTADTAIFTHVVSKGWGNEDLLMAACSSPSATDAPCFESADTGIFAADGTTRIGGTSQFSTTASLTSDPGQALIDVAVGFTTAQGANSDGFAIKANSIVKISISLPTSGTISGIDFGALPFSGSSGQTGLLVDPRTTSSSSATNRWDFANVSDRDIITITGQARQTSTAISRSTWYANCQINISSGTVSTTGCGEGMTSSVSSNYMVFNSVPSGMQLFVVDDPVMTTVAGGIVSTNAQGMTFGEETMTGSSFQFAVAGPSYTASDAPRTTDGFYYVCVPGAFLAGSFSTTAAAAVTDWVGTRDGASVATTFDTGTCGTGATGSGLVGYLDPFGYSAPLFALQPRAVSSPPSEAIPTQTTPEVTTTTTQTSTTTQTTTTQNTSSAPTATVLRYPALSVGKSVKPKYIARLAKFPKSYELRMSIPKIFRPVCKITAGKVTALKAGTCGVRVKATTPRGKIKYKRVYLSLA